MRGLVGIAVGAIFVFMPGLSTISYAVVTLATLAAWSIVGGVLEMTAAIRLRKEIEGEWLLGFTGFLSILLGIAIPVVLLLNSGATILSVAWIIGFYATAAGITLVALALRLRKWRSAGA